jgi:hypothetical protein
MKCAVQYMDKLDVLFKAYDYVATFMMSSIIITWIFVDNYRVYAVICGSNARYTSNAIYHALRAAGRRAVRRTPGSRRGCWIVSYV